MSEVQRILDAIFAISSDLELSAMLQRIVQVACDQTGAQYGAVEIRPSGVIFTDGTWHEAV